MIATIVTIIMYQYRRGINKLEIREYATINFSWR